MFRMDRANCGAATLAALFCAVGAAATLPMAPLAAKPPRRAAGAFPSLPDPRALLRRMLAAEAKIAYAGREVTQLADGRQSEQVVKYDPRRGLRREFIRPAGDLYVDDLRRSWFLSNRRQRLSERASRVAGRLRAARLALERIEGGALPARYDGRDVVAGRPAHIVRLGSAEGVERGPVRRYWIDVQTGLRLKTEEIGRENRVLSSSAFLDIDFHPRLSAADFQRPAPPPGFRVIREHPREFSSLAQARRQTPFSLRAPEYLPPGFALRVVQVREFRDRPVIAQIYTNGLDTFTLFQTSAALPPRSLRMPGSPRVLTWRDGSLAFTLIGDLPEAEMRRIAGSLR